MKKSFFCFIKLPLMVASLLFSLIPTMAQNVEDNKTIMKKVQAASDRYLFASSSNDTLERAKTGAVVQLASQICTDVKREDRLNISNINGHSDIAYDMVSKTFTDVSLSAYQALVVAVPSRKNTQYTVFVYIGKEKVDEILEEIREKEKAAEAERMRKITDNARFYYNEGIRSMKDARVGDALKNLYWCYALALDGNVSMRQDELMLPLAPLAVAKIDEVLNSISITAIASEKVRIDEFRDKNVITLDIETNYDGTKRKVTNLDYTYNDGNTFQRGLRARDGVGTLELQGDFEEVKVGCVYRYDESETPAEVMEVLQGKEVKSFEAATKVVRLTHVSQEAPRYASVEPDVVDLPSLSEEERPAEVPRDHDEMLRRMQSIEQAIRLKDFGSVRDYFTEEGYDSFIKLVKYGDASIVGIPQYKFLDFGSRTLSRGLTMQFRFKGNKQFIEKLAFRFDNDNLVESIAFTLSDVAESDILEKGDWERNSRLLLMTFLEDYQTAYALGREDYLERVFSDNALIIRGTKLVEKRSNDGISFSSVVKYDTLSKKDYMNHLRRHFRTKEYINLNFTDTDFDRVSRKKLEFYTIRVRQEYFSNNYGDVGWLFLLVDLRGEEPVIHVRAWQNDKLPLEALVGPDSFY